MSQERIARGYITASHGDDEMRTMQVGLQAGEVRDELEHMEPYGLSSEPIVSENTDALCAFFDESRGHGVVISFADRQYRFKSLKPGEVVLYDDKKRCVHFKREGILVDGVDDPITVKTQGDIKATSGANIDVTASGDIRLKASGKIEIQAGGNITIKGSTVNINE